MTVRSRNYKIIVQRDSKELTTRVIELINAVPLIYQARDEAVIAAAEAVAAAESISGAGDIIQQAQDAANEALAAVVEVTELVSDFTNIANSILVGTVTQTFRVPSQYNTMKAALDAARNLKVQQDERISVLIEAGHVLTGPVVMSNGDFSHVQIDSEDAEVKGSYANNIDAFTFLNCRTPIWNIVLDMQNTGRNGIYLEGSHMMAFAKKGVLNPGGFGSGEVRGIGLFVFKTSSFYCEPVVEGGQLVGFRLEGCAWRGLDVTHNSFASVVGCQLINNGTNPAIDAGHAHVFVSRASSVQLDNALFQGGVRGIRNARSMVSARKSRFIDVVGSACWQFEEGFIVAANSTFVRCGTSDFPMLLVQGTSSDRTQGGGTILAEDSTINGPAGFVAQCGALGAIINIDNCTINNVTKRLVQAGRAGRVSACLTSVAIGSTFDNSEVILVSDAAHFTGLGFSVDGKGLVRNIVRLTNGGEAHLRGATLLASTERPVRLDTEGCEAFLLGATFSAGVFMPSVYNLNIPVVPEHFGATGGGVAADQDAIVRWLSWGKNLYGREGSRYRLTARPASLFNLTTSEVVDMKGAEFIIAYTDTTASSSFTSTNGGTVKNAVFRFAANTSGAEPVANYVRRFFTAYDNVTFDNCTFVSDVDWPLGAVSDVRDAALVVRGGNITVRNCSFIGLVKCIGQYADTPSDNVTIESCFFDRFNQGISMRNPSLCSRWTIRDIKAGFRNSKISGQAPGRNVISGGASDMVIDGVSFIQTAEHGIYLSPGNGVKNLTMMNVYGRETSQSSIKLRGWDGVTMSNCHFGTASYDTATGSNEDGLHLECCTNVKVMGCSFGPSGGFDNFYIGSSSNIDVLNCWVHNPRESVVRLNVLAIGADPGDDPSATYTRYPLENINFINLSVRGLGVNRPLMMVGSRGDEVNVTLDRIKFEGLDVDGTTATNLIQIDATNASGAALTATLSSTMVVQGRMNFTNLFSGGLTNPELVQRLLRTLTVGRFTNANGEYVRFADGTQICTRTVGIDLTSAADNVFSYPASFVGPIGASWTISRNNTSFPGADRAMFKTALLSAGSTGWAFSTDGTGTSNPFNSVTLTAVGRWF